MSWDNAYKDTGNIWGERPSELAIAMVKHLRGDKIKRQHDQYIGHWLWLWT